MISLLMNMKKRVLIILVGLLFCITISIALGIIEDGFNDFVKEGIAVFPELQNSAGQDKIWGSAQRAHFHASAISAVSLGLIFLIMLSNLRKHVLKITAVLIGLSSFYPLSWFTMFLLARSLGGKAAQYDFFTEIITYIGIAGLYAAVWFVLINRFFNAFVKDDLCNGHEATITANQVPEPMVEMKRLYPRLSRNNPQKRRLNYSS